MSAVLDHVPSKYQPIYIQIYSPRKDTFSFESKVREPSFSLNEIFPAASSSRIETSPARSEPSASNSSCTQAYGILHRKTQSYPSSRARSKSQHRHLLNSSSTTQTQLFVRHARVVSERNGLDGFEKKQGASGLEGKIAPCSDLILHLFTSTYFTQFKNCLVAKKLRITCPITAFRALFIPTYWQPGEPDYQISAARSQNFYIEKIEGRAYSKKKFSYSLKKSTSYEAPVPAGYVNNEKKWLISPHPFSFPLVSLTRTLRLDSVEAGNDQKSSSDGSSPTCHATHFFPTHHFDSCL